MFETEKLYSSKQHPPLNKPLFVKKQRQLAPFPWFQTIPPFQIATLRALDRSRNWSPNCKQILKGDQKAIKDVEKRISAKLLPQKPDVKCLSIKQNIKMRTRVKSDEEFPIAYVVTVHKKAAQVATLLQVIYEPQNIYCFHIDKKAEKEFTKKIHELAECFSNVFIVSERVDVVYGSHRRLEADVNCLKDLLARKESWKYAINLVGQDFPLKSNHEIVQVLKSLNGSNSIPGTLLDQKMQTKQKHLINRYSYVFKLMKKRNKTVIVQTNLRKPKPPSNITIYFGTAFFIASRAFVKFALTSPKAKAIYQWFKDTYSPDENFWVTLNSLPEAPGGKSPPSWNSKVRFVQWVFHDNKNHDKCKGKYVRQICIFAYISVELRITQFHHYIRSFLRFFPSKVCFTIKLKDY